MTRVRMLAVVIVVALACASCGGDTGEASVPSTPATATSGAGGDTSTTGDSEAAGGSTSEATVPLPSGTPLLEGVERLVVLGPASAAGEVPLFSWEPVPGADVYDLAVLGPDGPLWAWRGVDTEVWLGALPFERPPGMNGPVIVDGSCWSVTALDADRHLVAASDFLPISPGDGDEHECVPGAAQG